MLARAEHDPDGPVQAHRVVRAFKRQAPVINLHLGGRIIETTAEHPFYAKGRGWVGARELAAGDAVLLRSGGWIAVDGVADSGRFETVYNVEVEEDHTYFVGHSSWGFTV